MCVGGGVADRQTKAKIKTERDKEKERQTDRQSDKERDKIMHRRKI